MPREKSFELDTEEMLAEFVVDEEDDCTIFLRALCKITRTRRIETPVAARSTPLSVRRKSMQLQEVLSAIGSSDRITVNVGDRVRDCTDTAGAAPLVVLSLSSLPRR